MSTPTPSAHSSQSRARSAPRFAYAANQNSHDVWCYALDASGVPQRVGTPVSVGRYPQGLALHPSGRSLFVANRGSNTVSVLSANPVTGELRANGPELANPSPGPVAILAHPSGSLVFVGSDDQDFASPDTVTSYAVDPDSDRLVPIAASETGSLGLTAITLDGSGRFLYTANALGDSITAFSLDACSGGLQRIAETATAPFPVALSAGPSGEFLYLAAGGAEPTIQTFSVDPESGRLRLLASLATSLRPWSLAAMLLDPAGEFLLLAANGDRGAATVSTWAIDAKTGVPRAVPASSVAAGVNATQVAIDPSGRFAYVSDFGSDDISAFSLDRERGTASPLGVVGAGSAPSALVISPGSDAGD